MPPPQTAVQSAVLRQAGKQSPAGVVRPVCTQTSGEKSAYGTQAIDVPEQPVVPSAPPGVEHAARQTSIPHAPVAVAAVPVSHIPPSASVRLHDAVQKPPALQYPSPCGETQTPSLAHARPNRVAPPGKFPGQQKPSRVVASYQKPVGAGQHA